jgi:prepilin-type N-terminal cleavage/methylation domain-containing protein
MAHEHTAYRQRSARNEAFTLTEVIMAMTVFGLVIAGVMSVFIGTIKSMHASSDAIDVNSRSRFVQERLLYDLRAIVKVTAISDKVDTSKIINGDTAQGFTTFTATVNAYNGENDAEITYSIKDDPSGKLKVLHRHYKDRVKDEETNVLTNLKGGCFTFYTRDSSGILAPLTDSSARIPEATAKTTTAIRFAFLPKDRGPLIPGKDDPSCSAVVQLRFPSYQ